MFRDIAKKAGVTCSMVVMFMFAGSAVMAADEVPYDENGNPPPAQPGETWCLCRKPAVYKTVTEQVQTAPASSYSEVIPAKFEMREEQILVCPETKKLACTPCKFKTESFQQLVQPERVVSEIIPARYEMVDETVLVTPAYDELVPVQQTLKTFTEQVMVSPGRKYWKKTNEGHTGHGELGVCFTLCEEPAKFVTVTKCVVDKDAFTEKRRVEAVYKTVKVCKKVSDEQIVKKTIPAEYATMTRQVLDTNAASMDQVIPAKYETIQKYVQVQPEEVRKQEIPAKFETISRQVLDQPERLVWRKVATHACDVVAKYKEVPGSSEEDLQKLADKRRSQK